MKYNLIKWNKKGVVRVKKFILFLILSMYIFSYYKIENRKVYYDGVLVEGAKSKDFEDLDGCYGKDKNNVYYRGEKVKKSDSQNFENLGNGYGKDKSNVYYYGDIIQ